MLVVVLKQMYMVPISKRESGKRERARKDSTRTTT
jgi:hypothetical protein